jgi:hypothetical protein
LFISASDGRIGSCDSVNDVEDDDDDDDDDDDETPTPTPTPTPTAPPPYDKLN